PALGTSPACYGETSPAPMGPSQSECGGVGLLPPPTARRAREGELSQNHRETEQYRSNTASVHLYPSLDTTLRYTDERTPQYS
ncbi:YjbH domain-containing protein, partial [Escherichia coli]